MIRILHRKYAAVLRRVCHQRVALRPNLPMTALTFYSAQTWNFQHGYRNYELNLLKSEVDNYKIIECKEAYILYEHGGIAHFSLLQLMIGII